MAVSYVLALLALHPEWQDAAHQELKDVFGEGDDYLRAPSLADLGRFGVLESIIKFFPDPQRFDPSRFLEDRVGKEHACCYLPFGLGARNCVGSQYGRLQLKVYLVDILRRFRFLPCSRREVSFSLNPIKPIRVSCMPLDGPRA
ncbi:cytochrome P450 4c21-like [Schistocerca serialis cubense]|uniref:cytochrome P450 4c21-like n=1 Tax=Schistocerca serialis cubense TaxID=2023355 RepID=UPI00214EDFFA|nr:cytochrome P450 4c21-like [Schistocerca serialis cubense]